MTRGWHTINAMDVGVYLIVRDTQYEELYSRHYGKLSYPVTPILKLQ